MRNHLRTAVAFVAGAAEAASAGFEPPNEKLPALDDGAD